MKRTISGVRTCLVFCMFSILPTLALAIDAPRDPRGTEVSQSAVKWEWSSVPGAANYEVVVDGRQAKRTGNTNYTSWNLWIGEHSMTVRAIDSSGNYSSRTQTAKITVNSRYSSSNASRSYLIGSTRNNESNSSSSASSAGFQTPQNARGSETGGRSVKWEWDTVSGASKYQVTVDGKTAGETGSTSYTSNNLWLGEHSMTVKAVNGNGSHSGQSKTAKVNVTGNASSSSSSSSSTSSSSSGSFQAPQNPTGSEVSSRTVKWQWGSVSGASKYEVTVDGAYIGETSSTNFTSNNLWVGEHSMTVKAVNSSGNRSSQSATAKANVNGHADAAVSSSSSAAPPPAALNDDSANVQSLIDPASYNYSEVNGKSGFELVFSDEFNGSALNAHRWHTQLRWDGDYNGERYEYRAINGEDQFYVNLFSPDQEHLSKIVPVYNPFKFNGSRLAIQATKNPLKNNNNNRAFGSLDQMSKQQAFLSGVLSTHEKFSQKFGYFEARIKIPSHVGTFPAFWLFHENRAWEGTQRSEIDIMENLGHAPWYIYNSFHYFKNVSTTYGGEAHFIKPWPSGQVYTGTDYSQDFHVYAVDWQPGKVTWYIDGQQVSTVSHNEVNHEELFLMINLAMGGNWTNYPANSGGLGRSESQYFPNQNDLDNFQNPSLEIDYVRVYRRK